MTYFLLEREKYKGNDDIEHGIICNINDDPEPVPFVKLIHIICYVNFLAGIIALIYFCFADLE